MSPFLRSHFFHSHITVVLSSSLIIRHLFFFPLPFLLLPWLDCRLFLVVSLSSPFVFQWHFIILLSSSFFATFPLSAFARRKVSPSFLFATSHCNFFLLCNFFAAMSLSQIFRCSFSVTKFFFSFSCYTFNVSIYLSPIPR